MFYAFMNPEQRLPDDESWQQTPAYQQWQEAMQQYAKKAGTDGARPQKFWILLRLPSNDFADSIEWLESPPMWIPAEGKGEFAGFATDSKEIDTLVDSTIDEETGNNKYVYLVYAAKIQGESAWRELLEYLGAHNMLEKF